MKKILFAILLSTTTTVASGVEYGIGTSLNISDTLYFPIRIGNYIFEPYVVLRKTDSKSEIESDGEVEFDSFDSRYRALGAGIFRNWPLSENVSVYAGGRIALARGDSYDPTIEQSTDLEEYIIAPTLGAQYLLHPRFSLGLEHRINHLSREEKTGNIFFSNNSDSKFTYTQTEVIGRIFF